MPFRRSFDCLWCGRHHEPRDPLDIEGWAQLCPDCVGRAGENTFLRFRLKAALDERAAARRADDATPAAGRRADDATPAIPPSSRSAPATTAPAPVAAPATATPNLPDDWYLRRGAFARGPVHDQAWQADLEAASSWLAIAPLAGRIVELGAATGWWSPVLARKGELWAIDVDPVALDIARDRLLAHGLRAHLHVRDPWAEPDAPADAVFAAFRMGRVPVDGIDGFLALVRRWLKPAGVFAFVEAAEDPLGQAALATPGADTAERPGPPAALPARPDAGPRPLAAEQLRAPLARAGFDRVEIVRTGRFLLLGTAHASGPDSSPLPGSG